jgi:hypothetical protein
MALVAIALVLKKRAYHSHLSRRSAVSDPLKPALFLQLQPRQNGKGGIGIRLFLGRLGRTGMSLASRASPAVSPGAPTTLFCILVSRPVTARFARIRAGAADTLKNLQRRLFRILGWFLTNDPALHVQ